VVDLVCALAATPVVQSWWLAVAAGLLVLAGELIHQQRLRKLGVLAFGPAGKPHMWTRTTPWLRGIAAAALAWGLATLVIDVEPVKHGTEEIEEDEWRHLVLVLDVSPSMRLEDAGPENKQSRLHRSRDVLNSIFSRVAMGHYKVTVVATYSGAMPVVIDSTDLDVIHNVLGDLPMHHAFKRGETRLFDGLEEAARIAKPWAPKSATLVVLSDGDTVPPTGMPKMPPSIAGALVVGVGDPLTGSFVDGRNSRQDVSSLRQMALRLEGSYHDGNKRHVASTVLEEITTGTSKSVLEQWSRREYALLAIGIGALLLAVIPWLLHQLGTQFQPGRRHRDPYGDPQTRHQPGLTKNRSAEIGS